MVSLLSYVLEQYKVFRSKENLKLYNFFPLPKELNWFYFFMKHRGIDKPINMFSVFGSRKLMKFISGKKIFYSGEFLQESAIDPRWRKFADHCVEEVDLSLGFDYLDNSNYLRFPIWILFFIRPDATFEDIKQKIKTINNSAYRLNTKKEKFACILARHDTNNIRKKILEVVNRVSLVTCAGKFMNNTDELSKMEANITKKYDVSGEFCFDANYTLKKEYLRRFIFNICPENANAKGYVTEKLFDAIESATIPIYWGGGKKEWVEPEVINPEAFLYYERGREDELIAQIEEIYENKEKYTNFANIPPFKETAPIVIWELLNEFEEKLKSL